MGCGGGGGGGRWIDWVCLAESKGESGCVSVGGVGEEAWFRGTRAEISAEIRGLTRVAAYLAPLQVRGASRQTLRVPCVPRSWGLCDQTAASACHSSILLPLPFLRAGRSGVQHVRGARGHSGRDCCDLALGRPRCIPQTLATGGCRSAFLSCVHRKKMSATGCLQTAGVSHLTVLWAGSPKSRCPECHVRSEVSRGGAFLASSSLWKLQVFHG